MIYAVSVYRLGCSPFQDAILANEGLGMGIPEPKDIIHHPGGDEPASWAGLDNPRYRG